MAWLIGDGFDFYTATTEMSSTGSIWTTASSFGSLGTGAVNTRFNAGVSAGLTANVHLDSVSFANSGTIYVNFALMTTASQVAGNVVGVAIELYDGATLQCQLFFIEDGSIALADHLSAIYAGTRTAANTFVTNVWHQYQAKIVIDPTAGTFELRQDGNTPSLITATGLATRNSANSQVNALKIHCLSNVVQCFVDDFYAFNSLGVQPNTWQGDVRSVQMMPAGDFSKQWTPNSGVLNYNRVNELRQDGDTTYVSDATPGHVDQYSVTALGVNPLNIVGAQLKMFTRMDDSGPHTVSSRLTSNGTTDDSVSTNLTTTYQWVQTMYTTDPHTGSTWAVGNLNAVTIGPVDIL